MMGVKKIIILCLISITCLAANDSISQQPKDEIKTNQYRAIHWTMAEGLSGDGLNTMIKDAKGFLWIGSRYGGFCRFDGASFKKYIPGQHDRNTINSDKILAFTEDSLNNIWIETEKGLSRYDIKADTFTNFSPFIDTVSSEWGVAPFAATRDEIYCFEPGSLITAINIHTLKRTELLRLPKEDDPGIAWNTNKSFFDAKSKSIWMLSINKKYGLEQVFLDGRIKYYQWPCYRDNHQHRHNAEDIKYDSRRNSVWINSGEGLLEFSMNEKKFRNIEALDYLTKSKDYDRNVGIDMDVNGKIWLSTRFKGIFIYDPETDGVRPVFSNPDLQIKAGDANLHIYCDRDGITWTSNWLSHGIYEILPYNPPVKRFDANAQKKDSLSNLGIHSIIPSSNDELWIGTEDGINILDTKTEKFRVLREKDLPGLTGLLISPVHIDTAMQKAWLISAATGTDPGNINLYEMDLTTKRCRPVKFRDGTKPVDNVSSPAYCFWPYKNGLLIANEYRGIFQVKQNSLFADLLIPFESFIPIGRMVVVEDHLIFLQQSGSLPNHSFQNKNGKWIKLPHLLDTLEWQSMFYDKKDKTYWVSFKYDLVHYDKDFRTIKIYKQEDGYSGMAFGMITDNAGNLWFKNNLHQVNRLDKALGVISNLSENDGYYKQVHTWHIAAGKDGAGNIYFGGINFGSSMNNGGLDRIHPERYTSPVTSSVYLLSLFINQKSFPLSVGINNLEELSLRHNQNTISIEAGIIDYYANGKGHIRYKLRGGDNEEDWQYGPAYNTIRYEKLPPGKYELVLQASNAGNEFNSAEKILSINVRPPFWQTWWFRTLAILFTALLLYAFIHFRSRHLKERNIILEKKVLERTTELNNSLAELKTTQDQLIQSEKMASLGELTSGIAHEIKNPLNFINNFSEINLELITEVEEEQGQSNNENNQDGLAQIIKTLKKNSEKINHHGHRIDEIVKGMLQHSRLGNVNKEPVNINSICDESLKLAYHGFRAKEKTFNASFETRFEPDLPNIMVVPQDFGRVMLNLINNAFYTVNEKKKRNQAESADTLQTELSYKPSVIVGTSKQGNKIYITVSDNGMGIPSSIINKVFQPFFTTKPTGEGTGLGLSMSYDIIAKTHGGELRAKSKEGIGTDFEIILPIQ